VVVYQTNGQSFDYKTH